MEKVPISVVIITKNEEDKISQCLESVGWADEIIVVDDESSDSTVTLAKKFTEKIFTRKMDIEGRHRNYAYSLAKNDWVLSLDADELVSSELREKLSELFKSEIPFSAYTIPIKTYIGKHWIRYGGWYPANKVRLFRKGKMRYEEAEVHPRVFIEGPTGHMDAGHDILHYSYRDFHDYFISLNNQTTLEAVKWFKEKRKIGFLKMTRKFIDRFLKSFLLKKGYKDGIVGFLIAYGSGLYQFMSYVKYVFMKKHEKGDI